MCGMSWSELQNCFGHANSEGAFRTCLKFSGFNLKGEQTSDGMIKNDGDSTTTDSTPDDIGGSNYLEEESKAKDQPCPTVTC